MINHTDKKLVEYLINFINSNEKFNKLFNHHKQIYSMEDLFTALIYKLTTGISYKNISKLKTNIKGSNLHYFHKKIVKYNLFEEFYNYYISIYINNIPENKYFYVDSTLIANKLGINNATYNIQLKKHKSTKISIIIDDFGIPIDFKITNSNNHDSSIFSNQLDTIVNKYPNLCTNDKIFIGDSAYDSNNIRHKLKNCKLGKLISDRNKRNTKDKNKLHKLDLYSKMLLKKRSKIEHVNNILKKNKTINTRYEKYSINYI
jgi:hypothetical protein